MHWILIVLFILYIAFVVLYRLMFKNKKVNAKKFIKDIDIIEIAVASGVFILTLIFGIIGHCGACITFIILNILAIALAFVYYLYGDVIIAKFKDDKEEKQETESQEDSNE